MHQRQIISKQTERQQQHPLTLTLPSTTTSTSSSTTSSSTVSKKKKHVGLLLLIAGCAIIFCCSFIRWFHSRLFLLQDSSSFSLFSSNNNIDNNNNLILPNNQHLVYQYQYNSNSNQQQQQDVMNITTDFATGQVLLQAPTARYYTFVYSKSHLQKLQQNIQQYYYYQQQEQQQRFLSPLELPSTNTTINDINNNTTRIVFGILSHPKQAKRRNAIRQSWGYQQDLLFVLAQDEGNHLPNNTTSTSTSMTTTSSSIIQQQQQSIMNQVYQELKEYKDLLILQDAIEDYRNTLVPKTFTMIYFFATFILSSSSMTTNDDINNINNNNISYFPSYLFKTDDDVYVNTSFIHQELSTPRQDGPPKDYFGRAHIRTKPTRYNTSKHYLSKKEYPDKYFPNYAEGVGYGISSTFAKCASTIVISQRVKVPWEDVATGVLARRCHIRLTIANYSHMYTNETHGLYFPYDLYKDGMEDIQITHGVNKPHWMIQLHNKERLT